MCGIFGFVSKTGSGPDIRTLERIACVTERRGPHAFGFAWIDGDGRLRCFKQRGRISQSLPLLAMAADARMLIGHTRFVTQGDPEQNINNHPHPCDGGWLVHNGIIRTYRTLIEHWGLHPVSDCDSEVLALLIEQLPGTLLSRCKDAVRIAGDSPLAIAALWRDPQRLIAIRDGNPLALGENGGGWYFGSLEQGLPSAKVLPDRCVLSFTRTGRIGSLSRKTLEPERVLLTPQKPAPQKPIRTTQPRFPMWPKK